MNIVGLLTWVIVVTSALAYKVFKYASQKCSDLVFTHRIGKLTALSLNVGGIFTTPYKVAHICEYLKRASKEYDIICLQECFFPWIYMPIEVSLSNMYHVSMPNALSSIRINGGCMIFSKFKIYDTLFRPFKQSNSFDSWSQKGVLFCTIDTPIKPLRIGCTHLQDSVYDIEGLIRKTQLHDIKSVGYNADVIIGDFNICMKRDINLFTGWHEYLGIPAIPQHATGEDGNIYDYAFYKNDYKVKCQVRYDLGNASDHFPVAITIYQPK